MIRAGVMTPAGVMKDITGYYKDPSTGTYRFVAKGEPIRVPTKPAATAALTQFLASQTAAHEAQQRAERVRTFDLKSMTATEKADVGIQMFHAFTGMRGRLRDITLAQQPEPPPATPATKTRTEAFTTMLWGEEASERIAEREERKASGRKRAREDIFGAALSIKPGLEHVFSPTTKEISVLTAPWYAKQQKKVGLGGEAEAREAQKLSEEYQRAITGKDRRSISEIRDIEQRLSTSYTKYEAARGPPPLSLTEAEKKRTWAHKSHQVAQGIRGLTLPEVTGVTPVAKLVQEGAAGITEYFGGAPTALKYGTPLLAKEPALIVPLAAVAGVGFGKAVYHEPAQTATTFAMTWGISKGIGTGMARSPIKAKPTIIRLPHAKGVGFGLEIQRGGVTKFKPVISVMPKASKTITFGTPKVSKVAFTQKTPFTPRTALEADIVARSLGLEGGKITHARGVRWETTRAGMKPAELTAALTETLSKHDISAKSTAPIIKTMQVHRGEIYGSIIQRATTKKALGRVSRDIDYTTRTPKGFARDAAAAINLAEGRLAVIVKGHEVIVRHTGAKLFDIHAIEKPPTSFYGRTEIGFGLKPERISKVEGVKMRSYSEQMSRKLEGGMVVGEPRTLTSPMGTVSGRIVPKHVGRIKDIADYYIGEKASITRLRTKGKTRSATRAEQHLETWLDLWDKDLASTIREAQRTGAESGVSKVFLHRFGEPLIKPITGMPVPLSIDYTIIAASRSSIPPLSTGAATPPLVSSMLSPHPSRSSTLSPSSIPPTTIPSTPPPTYPSTPPFTGLTPSPPPTYPSTPPFTGLTPSPLHQHTRPHLHSLA
jgi:hypothetical protein